jgi:hypothetical protein
MSKAKPLDVVTTKADQYPGYVPKIGDRLNVFDVQHKRARTGTVIGFEKGRITLELDE